MKPIMDWNCRKEHPVTRRDPYRLHTPLLPHLNSRQELEGRLRGVDTSSVFMAG